MIEPKSSIIHSMKPPTIATNFVVLVASGNAFVSASGGSHLGRVKSDPMMPTARLCFDICSNGDVLRTAALQGHSGQKFCSVFFQKNLQI